MLSGYWCAPVLFSECLRLQKYKKILQSDKFSKALVWMELHDTVDCNSWLLGLYTRYTACELCFHFKL